MLGVAAAPDLLNAASTWNDETGVGIGRSSKYVSSVQISGVTGMVTVTFSPAAGAGPAPTLTLTPWMRSTPAGEPFVGALAGWTKWGHRLGLRVGLQPDRHDRTEPDYDHCPGTLQSKYAPAQCR